MQNLIIHYGCYHLVSNLAIFCVDFCVDFPDFGDASPKNTLIGQELLHQTIVNYKKIFSNIIIKVSPFGITI